MASSRTALETLIWLIEDAFDGDPDYSLWGNHLPTRKLLRIMIAHDFYHASKINHIRALLQGRDRWPYK